MYLDNNNSGSRFSKAVDIMLLVLVLVLVLVELYTITYRIVQKKEFNSNEISMNLKCSANSGFNVEHIRHRHND